MKLIVCDYCRIALHPTDVVYTIVLYNHEDNTYYDYDICERCYTKHFTQLFNQMETTYETHFENADTEQPSQE